MATGISLSLSLSRAVSLPFCTFRTDVGGISERSNSYLPRKIECETTSTDYDRRRRQFYF